jgi:hypothetical protein
MIQGFKIRMVPKARQVRLTPKIRKVLEACCWAPSTARRVVKRARMVLLAAAGRSTRSGERSRLFASVRWSSRRMTTRTEGGLSTLIPSSQASVTLLLGPALMRHLLSSANSRPRRALLTRHLGQPFGGNHPYIPRCRCFFLPPYDCAEHVRSQAGECACRECISP